MDGTDFRIQQVQPFWKGWYSHKFHGPGVRYEIGIGIQTGDIVWVNGPFPCGAFADITIFREKLKAVLESVGERAEADGGYDGEPMLIDLPTEGCFSGKRQKYIKQRVRSRHETLNRRFKQFFCLQRCFRHNIKMHKICLFAAVVIVQLENKFGDGEVFQVKEYKTETH